MSAGRNGERRVTRRARYQRSRFGCRTCKIRRVRCDGTTPACTNCVSTGRSCDGVVEDNKFIFVGPSDSHHQARSDRSDRTGPATALSPPRSQDELRSFHIFLIRAAPLFSTGALDAGFWRGIVPRLSQSMTFAWDAAISIGMLYENPVDSAMVGSLSNGLLQLQPQQLQALQWYSRSVSGVTQRIGSNRSEEILALFSCALFTACEFQQGNSATGFALLEHGLTIGARYLSPERLAMPVLDATASLEQVVLPFFTRHALFFWLMNLPRLYRFTSLATTSKLGPLTARFSEPWLPHGNDLQGFIDLLYRSHELTRASMLVLDQPWELQWIAKLQAPLLESLDTWHHQLISMSETAPTPEHATSISYLRLYHAVATILVSTCLSAEETAFDDHLPRFKLIVDIATTLRLTSDSPPPPLDLGAAPSLYFTATRCRDPQVRLSALALLRTSHPPPASASTASIWHVLPILQIVEQIIAFEEAGTSASGTQPPRRATDLPEESRVHHVQVLTRPRSLLCGGGRELAMRFITYSSTRQLREHAIDLPEVPMQT